MRYRVIRNWIESAELMTRKSFIIIPFLIWGLIEAIALELLYFFPGAPLKGIVSPIVTKFFGQQYVHYPGNLTILPKLFSYTELLIYILVGAFLSVITVDLVVRLTKNTQLKTKEVLEATIRRYLPCLAYAVIIVTAGILIKRYHPAAFDKLIKPFMKHLPTELSHIGPFVFFVSLLMLQLTASVFLISTLPIMVIRGRFFILALFESIYRGILSFFTIFALMFVPYLLYIPVVLLKSYQGKLVSMTFHEIVFHLNLAGIFILKLVGCFVIVCVTRFLLEKQGLITRKEEYLQ